MNNLPIQKNNSMLKSNEIKLKIFLSLIINGIFLIFYCLNAYFFNNITSSVTFFFRSLLFGIIGFFIIFCYTIFAEKVVHFLNQRQITHSHKKRWLIELFLVMFTATIFTFFTYQVMPFPLDGNIRDVPIHQFIMMFLPNFSAGIIIFAIIELWNTFQQNRDLQLTLANIEKEKVTAQLTALQQKINPHFLFNSLSVLSELIHENPKKADDFVREFTKVYRYVLDFNVEPVVMVKRELTFLNAYLFLQKIRFGESLKIENQLDDNVLNQYIPPLSLQLLFENAMKHNRVCKSEPLVIRLTNNIDYLLVTNNLQMRLNVPHSKGVGLSNLKKTYRLISENQPNFFKTKTEFVAKIPLVNIAL